MHQNNSVEFHGASLPVIELGEGAPIGYLHGVLGNPAVPEFVSMLAAGGHTITFRVDTNERLGQEIKVELTKPTGSPTEFTVTGGH